MTNSTVKQGLKNIARRSVNAHFKFINAVMEQFGKTEQEALKVLHVFKKFGAVKLDAISGQFTLKDGRFWEKEVINRALNEVA